MRSVLFLAFHYPPIGGAGVQRNIQLVARLPQLGFSPLVVTGPGAPDYRWTPADPSLAADATEASVARLPGPEPAHGARWEGRAERWLRVPTRWQRWWFANVLERARGLEADVDLVHASLRPYSTAGAAIAVARLLDRPLVLDLEDPWALDEMMVYPTKAHRRLEVRRMRRVLSEADAVVMNTSEATRRTVESFPELATRIVRAAPNAFEPSEFAEPPPDYEQGRFRIVHTGSMHMDLGLSQRGASRVRRALGGHLEGVDFLSRSHVHLVTAVRA